jgi:hypothetical protein
MEPIKPEGNALLIGTITQLVNLFFHSIQTLAIERTSYLLAPMLLFLREGKQRGELSE